jgi:lysozyme
MAEQKLTNQQKVGLAAAIAAAVAIAAPIAAKWEGYSPKVYKDPAGIPTYCYGETELLQHDPSHIYVKTECMELLRKRMQRDYAPKIAACLPEIADNRFVFGSLIDASYNAGPIAVCQSSMARLIKAGQVRAACKQLPSWYVTAQRRVNGKRVGKPFLLPGLVHRRKDERRVCLTLEKP